MGRPKKKVRDIRVVGYIPPKYWKRVLEMVEDGYYKSISEIVTKGVIRFVDSYQKKEEEYTNESDRLKKETLRRMRRKEIDKMLHEMTIEEYEDREEKEAAEAENTYFEEQDRKDEESSLRRLMRKGLTKAQAKELSENVKLAFEDEKISISEAQEVIKEGKFVDYATLVNRYKPKKKRK